MYMYPSLEFGKSHIAKLGLGHIGSLIALKEACYCRKE